LDLVTEQPAKRATVVPAIWTAGTPAPSSLANDVDSATIEPASSDKTADVTVESRRNIPPLLRTFTETVCAKKSVQFTKRTWPPRTRTACADWDSVCVIVNPWKETNAPSVRTVSLTVSDEITAGPEATRCTDFEITRDSR
jgi:hypothetical protein